MLVASAAIVKTNAILDFDPEDWRRIIDVNLTGAFHCCQLAGRQMLEKGWGRIITVSSVNGQIANTGRGAYSCTKGGVGMLTRLLATELGDKGITANAVAPVPVDTPMVLQVHGPKDRAAWEAQIPAKRYAKPEEVASAIKFLASDDAGYINGHILNVDGGFMASGVLIR
nr:SDR family NAD(P)-dependent oxidoreductase [Roseovarius sp. THAF9]